MLRKLLVISLTFLLLVGQAFARTSKKKKSSSKTSSSKSLNKKSSKPKKSKNKKRRRRGHGPDLKKITTSTSFEKEPTNGVNDIENDQLYKGKQE